MLILIRSIFTGDGNVYGRLMNGRNVVTGVSTLQPILCVV